MIRFGILHHVGRTPSTIQATLKSLQQQFSGSVPMVFSDDGGLGAALNLARALDVLGASKFQHVCVLDDDLVLAPGTRQVVDGGLSEFPGQPLSLWTIEQNIPHWLRDRMGWVPVTPHANLWGGAVVMPREIAHEVAAFIRAMVHENAAMATKPDACIYDALRYIAGTVHFHIPSLADHIGLESSTLGNDHAAGETRGYLFNEWTA